MTTLAKTLSSAKTISIVMPTINWRRFCITGMLLMATLIFLSLVLYVYQVNELTRGNYTIKNYEKEISNLSNQNAKLETSFAEIAFLGDIEQKAKNLNFRKITDIKYIQVLPSYLALTR